MHRDSVWEQLEEKKESVLVKWSQLILDTYPADTASFLREERDRFINPVGQVIARETKVIYDELLHGMDLEKLADSLDEIIRIRSVQDFSASQAIGFIFALKQAVREALAGEIADSPAAAGLRELESRVDRLVLLAFDIYMRCRESIYEIRVDEMARDRDAALRIMVMANRPDDAGETA